MSAAQVAGDGYAFFRVKSDATVWAGLDAPVAGGAFLFVNVYDAVFRLHERVFWAGFDAWGVFAEFAGYCGVE